MVMRQKRVGSHVWEYRGLPRESERATVLEGHGKVR